MSSATGTIFDARSYDEDKIVGYFEYNGTCDFARPKIFLTNDECFDQWHEDQGEVKCTCLMPSMPVFLHADYGDGLEWDSTACFNCMCITGNTNPYPRYDPWEQYWGPTEGY